jgi:hypothetical protein
MHDTDRTLAEFESGNADFETDTEFDETEFEHDSHEFEGEFDGEFDGEFELAEEYEGETEGVFGEAEEMQLAADLLEVSDEQELDQFLGKLIKRASGVVRKVAKTPVGNQLVGILKGAARKALPIAGTALGGYLGGPMGAQLGGQLATGAGKFFGLELEGMSQEDREFEVARRFVRFAGDATRRALVAPGGMPPRAAVRSGVIGAARRHAPGLLRPAGRPRARNGNGRGQQRGNTGRWVRVAPNRIVLYGI